MRIFLTGSTAYDYLMKFPGYFKDHILPEHLDKVSLSFLVDEMIKQRGGVGANIAYTLALLGAKPFLISNAGLDFMDYQADLEKMGVDTSGVMISTDKFTASFFVSTDLANAQIASFYAGAMADATKISLLNQSLTKDDLVVISPNDPQAMVNYCHECTQISVPFVFDPGQQIVRMKAEDLKYGILNTHALFVNEYEFELLQKHTGMSTTTILSTPKFVVVTLGEQGSVIYEGTQVVYRVPVVPADRLADPTGVGDAYRAGFLLGYMKGWGLEICGQLGALAATYCIENSGTQKHFYTKAEFVNRFRKHFDDQKLLDAIL